MGFSFYFLGSDMIKLTAKQEKFCQCIADGMTQSDAYRAAFCVKNMKPETIWVRASELMADGKVKVRVAEIKSKLESKSLWTREMSVKALVAAYKEGAPSVKVSAVKELNAMHGFNEPIKVDHSSTDGSMASRSMTPKEIEEELLRRGLNVKIDDE